MAEEITGLSSMATRHVLTALCSEIERTHQLTLRFRSAGGVEAARQVRDGAEVDVLVLAEAAMTELHQDQFFMSGSLRPMFVSEVVAAVPTEHSPPPFTTEEDLAAALLAATRIAYSTGPSGVALMRLFEDWRLGERLADKLVQAPPGVPVGELLARRDADLGFQQRSELMDSVGVLVLGPLPGTAAIRSTFSGGVLASTAHQAAAAEALRLLTSPAWQDTVRSRGLELAPSST